MQLGTRWPVGAAAPGTLPAVVLAAVGDVEEELAVTGVDTRGWSWTLTWLERRPVVELDDGTRIEYLPADGATPDAAVVRQPIDGADAAGSEDPALGGDHN